MTASVIVLPTAARSATASPVTSLMICADPARRSDVESTGQTLGAQSQVLSTAAEIRDYADRHAPPDTCAIVTPLPDGPVLPLIRMLRSRGWHKVAVLSSKADARAVHAALISGVRTVVVRADTEPTPRPPVRTSQAVPLSDRELQVLRMVADGKSNRQVGEQLGLSALTIKSHLARIARKLGSGDRAHLVATAIRNGYIR
ncbi:MAG TPA: response regulator transcription factor [Actinomycetota bacterium]|nr:response regulator transcription factor [Candidatus Nanopelagicales bacterium]HPE13695.1 response regulator transcription factor [Actinomycetota bacterium]HPJ18687.1 response regulator transcription factor [Actinomycetota bacterium]HPQ84227.1 response regulator transcription factor [Actinomycetota bacterium]HRV65296.1 response regulator transcription factor [Candidatus Nanopelagicales bacterium]